MVTVGWNPSTMRVLTNSDSGLVCTSCCDSRPPNPLVECEGCPDPVPTYIWVSLAGVETCPKGDGVGEASNGVYKLKIQGQGSWDASWFGGCASFGCYYDSESVGSCSETDPNVDESQYRGSYGQRGGVPFDRFGIGACTFGPDPISILVDARVTTSAQPNCQSFWVNRVFLGTIDDSASTVCLETEESGANGLDCDDVPNVTRDVIGRNGTCKVFTEDPSIDAGQWESATGYVAHDTSIASVSGETFMANEANTNKDPDTNPDEWFQIS